MGLPGGANTTCAILRGGSPVASGIPCHLQPSVRQWANTGGALFGQYSTHKMLVGPEVDIRDGFGVNNPVTLGLGPSGGDVVLVPDANSKVRYAVAQVIRIQGGGLDCKKVFLIRTSAQYPTNDV